MISFQKILGPCLHSPSFSALDSKRALRGAYVEKYGLNEIYHFGNRRPLPYSNKFAFTDRCVPYLPNSYLLEYIDTPLGRTHGKISDTKLSVIIPNINYHENLFLPFILHSISSSFLCSFFFPPYIPFISIPIHALPSIVVVKKGLFRLCNIVTLS
jgi:hypothetical protein